MAVLSVIIYHLNPSLLPGGFLGVDVFFVVSGYLITGIILRENQLKIFSFSNFYSRRIKRIFPALFTVLGLSSILATFLFPPLTFSNFIKSAKYASFQFANFFFAQEVGYFNESLFEQPLLHIWTLGVEEQFYLFWPLLIVSIFWLIRKTNVPGYLGKYSQLDIQSTKNKPNHPVQAPSSFYEQVNSKYIAGAFLLLALLSFIACYYYAETNLRIAFYMFYTRAWEFCIGGLVALNVLHSPKTKTGNNISGVLGLLLLSYSFLFISDTYLGIPFLQLGVVIPCIGTSLILHSNWQIGIISKILSTKLPVFIGKISYSLYLFHWPIIIFYKIFYNKRELSIEDSLIILLVSLILATLSYLLIEQPARKTKARDRSVLTCAFLVILTFVIGLNTLRSYDMAAWRISKYATENSKQQSAFPRECSTRKKGEVHYYKCKPHKQPNVPYIALVGDSHTIHYLASAVAWAKEKGFNIIYLSTPGCPMLLGDIQYGSTIHSSIAPKCKQYLPFFAKEIVENENVKLILMAQRFDLLYDGNGFINGKQAVFFLDSEGNKITDHTRYYRDQLAYTTEIINKNNKELVLLKQIPLLWYNPDCDWELRLKKHFSKKRNCSYDYDFIEQWQRPSIDFIDDFVATHNVKAFDPEPYFDSPLKGDINLYGNNDHLNGNGCNFLVPHFVEAMDKIMPEILPKSGDGK